MEDEKTVSSDGVKPPFVSGGVQGGRIVNILGNVSSAIGTGSGAFTLPNSYIGMAGGNNVQLDRGNLTFDASRVVRTGADVAGINLSVQYWRRVS
jgi:hypothetical protein